MRNKKPRVIGLTGGVGTGKTTVAHMFKQLGAKVVDSDRLAHKALKKGTPTYKKICHAFKPDSILNSSGSLNKKKIAALIFNNARKKKILESIIHPFVFLELSRFIKKHKGVCVLEVPLLFETGFHRKVDKTVVVAVSQKIQIDRLKKKTGLETSEIKKRIKSQMSLAEKKKKADYVIRNERTLSNTQKQVKHVWEKIFN